MSSFNDKYESIAQIGEGSFSQVLKVRDRQLDCHYAAKRMMKSFENLAEANEVNEIRAIKCMESHPNVIGLVDIIFEPSTGTLYLISELFDQNLYEYIRHRKRHLSEVRVKNFLYQLTKGLHHLHSNALFHRDLKPENILVRSDPALRRSHPSRADVIQLADLGSCTPTSRQPPYSAYVSTRWYRAPESLLTAGHYGPKIDIWALGCVFYELLTLSPLFPGDNELDQLHRIHAVLGVPSKRTLSRFRKLSVAYTFPRQCRETGLHHLVPALSAGGYALLERTLTYVPDGRVSSEKLLADGYFDDLRTHEQKIHRAFGSSASSVVSASSRSPSISSNRSNGTTTSATNSRNRSRSSGTRRSSVPKRSAGSALSSKSGVSTASTRQQQPTEMKIRERLWGMNAGTAKSILQKNIKTAVHK